MENYLNILAEAAKCFGWKEWLCLLLSSYFASFVGAIAHAMFKDLSIKDRFSIIVDICMLLFAATISVWCTKPFWAHPAHEIIVTIVMWLILCVLLGFYESYRHYYDN